ncbi:MFS transporter [Derxia lacustris]|uniref:MFS transporter n=1 Tax=Derxia lacustris TaxID=764842 RepID=UPI000A1749E8|nr:MFS transporter [Derxia lacustris]
MSRSTPSPAAPPRASLAVTLLVAGSFFMENLDGTVIVTALPAMAADFGVAPIDLNLGTSAYLIALAVFATASGWIADRFGTRRVFAGAIVLFTLASLLCAASGALPMFVAMRVLQGLGGALMVPVGRLVVLRGTPRHELIRAIATLTWPALVAPVLGPPVGGFITEHFGWQWIFLLNLPLGLLAFALALRLLPRTPGAATVPFDWAGFGLAGSALFCTMACLESLGQPAPSALFIAASAAAGVTLGALAWRRFRRVDRPLIDLGALAVPSFGITARSGSLFRVAIAAVPFLVPLMFQLGFGYDAVHAGLLVLVVFAGNIAIKPATTAILRRLGFRRTLLLNGLGVALSIAACGLLTPATPLALTVAVLFVSGMCRSMQFTTLNTLAFADIAQPRMSGANTLFNLASQVSMGLGVALGALALRIGHAALPALGLAGTPALAYRIAFAVVGLVALAGLVESRRLAPDAGAQLLAPPR